MKVKLYKFPKKTGWLGWVESCRGDCIGFVRLNGSVIFDW